MAFWHPRCGLCGERRSDVGQYGTGSSAVKRCTRCRKVERRSDRSTPYGAGAAGYRSASGRPPHLAGPMGGRYRGPAPAPQRRR
jgi:hypothetical protein